jgi:hypothetical protein
MSLIFYTIIFFVYLSMPAAADATHAAALLIELCIGGGSSATLHSDKQDQLRIDSGSNSAVIDRHEASGLVEGIHSKISTLEADQANRVRDCVRPYIGDIMALELPRPANHPPLDPPARFAPTPTAVSLLSSNHRTNIMDEATDFGVIPTKGLNLNVANYTPSYINGGAVITQVNSTL